MSAAEFAFWKAYRDRHGFPVDRLEAGTVLAGVATARAMGSKVEPKHLIPRFGPQRVSMKTLAAQLAALPGAKVRYIPRPDRKPKQLPPAPDGPGPAPKVLNPRR
ncbi:unnamed protein product [Gemmata massiliana]|uniref:Minor tail T domain-containing protein n=1 Tax=Gemmata massiliana TaxID=1210884 RepID=A0A6P2DKM0_9BACT|nr:hypothetical protein [Gemmata massiliana]VTS03527.1 unnamed protein product [Gemmata massiliana]